MCDTYGKDFKEQLHEMGIDGEATLARFMNNEALLKKFLHKFGDQNLVEELKTATDKKDFEGMERQSHTLKGVAANLGMNRLAERCNDMVKKLRAGDHDGLESDYEAIKDENDRLVEALKTID